MLNNSNSRKFKTKIGSNNSNYKKQGGYAKKNKITTRVPEAIPVVKKHKPLLPGIALALTAMAQFSKELATLTDQPVVVSIDPIDDKWTLVVRGWNPGVDIYFFTFTDKAGNTGFHEMPVIYRKSKLVRNPLARNK